MNTLEHVESHFFSSVSSFERVRQFVTKLKGLGVNEMLYH